jgi:hypothetical protein
VAFHAEYRSLVECLFYRHRFVPVSIILKRVPLFILLALSGCGYPPPPCLPLSETEKVAVVSAGWHSEIAIPVEELSDGLQDIAPQLPGAKTLLFGYGKKTFMTAPPGTVSKYFTGILPGEAAIEVTGIDSDLAQIYKPDEVVTLALPPGGAAKLSAFIRSDLSDNPDGTPAIIAHSDNPPAFVYAANSQYTFLHTCNGWAAQALVAAGVSLSSSRVVTSGRLMGRAREATASCH